MTPRNRRNVALPTKRVAAIYVPPGSIPEIFGENHGELTINLGGRNIYRMEDGVVRHRESNEFLLTDFDKSGISLFSCIVGGNGSGKTSLMRLLTGRYHLNYVVEFENGEFRPVADLEDIHRIYYTPYLHEKPLDSVGNNGKDLSKAALLKMDNHGDGGLLDEFLARHHSENFKRWLKFNHFYRNLPNAKIRLPVFRRVTLSLAHFSINIHRQDGFNDTSYQLRAVIRTNLEKIDAEEKEREHAVVSSGDRATESDNGKAYFLVRFEYELYELVMGKFASVLERAGNTYLNEGIVPENFEDAIAPLSVRDSIEWFVSNCGVYNSNQRYLFSHQSVLIRLIDYVRTLIVMDNLTNNFRKIIITEEQTLEVINLYDEFNSSFDNAWFRFDESPMFEFTPEVKVSSGEQQFLNLFSTLYFHAENVRQGIDIDLHSSDSLKHIRRNILLLLDEGDNSFHPQWKKEYVKYLRNVIPVIFKGWEVQIVITTHDPLTLSDIPRNNVIFLERGPAGTVIGSSTSKRTFGANISDMLKDTFFLEDGQIGSYAADMIRDAIIYLNGKDYSEEKTQKVAKLIKVIDEPVIKFKLAEMYSEAFGNSNLERELVDQEIARLQKKRGTL